jgi:hypothetical protein
MFVSTVCAPCMAPSLRPCSPYIAPPPTILRLVSSHAGPLDRARQSLCPATLPPAMLPSPRPTHSFKRARTICAKHGRAPTESLPLQRWMAGSVGPENGTSGLCCSCSYL